MIERARLEGLMHGASIGAAIRAILSSS